MTDCSTCQDLPQNLSLECGHTFLRNNLIDYLFSRPDECPSCPTCNTVIDYDYCFENLLNSKENPDKNTNVLWDIMSHPFLQKIRSIRFYDSVKEIVYST